MGATNLNLAGCGISAPDRVLKAGSRLAEEDTVALSGTILASGYYWFAVAGGVPDVSMFGDSPGYWVYSSYLDDPTDNCNPSTTVTSAWFGCAGTSLSTPLWAGL